LNPVLSVLALGSLLVLAGCYHRSLPGSTATPLFQFAMYARNEGLSSECELVERFSPDQDKQLRFAGTLDGYGCWVLMPQDLYERKFQFCYLAGFNLHEVEGRQSTECFIQRRDEDYAFLAHIGEGDAQGGQVMCYFTCVGRKHDASATSPKMGGRVEERKGQ